jgi:hypothetical protein
MNLHLAEIAAAVAPAARACRAAAAVAHRGHPHPSKRSLTSNSVLTMSLRMLIEKPALQFAYWE